MHNSLASLDVFRTASGLLIGSTILVSGIAQAQERSQVVEQRCNNILQEVRAEIWQRHLVAVSRVEMGTVSESGWQTPVSRSGEAFERRYSLALGSGYGSEAYHRAENFLFSPVTMQYYAQKISDGCRPVSMVIFARDGTDSHMIYGLGRDGKMFLFECNGLDSGDPRIPRVLRWGLENCPRTDGRVLE